MAFVQDLDDGPHRVTVDERSFALFRADGRWQALLDRCPHRAARLSDGVLHDGRLECLYHGWQFGHGGTCLHIPQLLAEQSIPARAHVSAYPVREAQGIVWLRPDAAEAVDDGAAAADDDVAPPLVDALDDEATRSIDFMIDLPYEQSFLIENVIDIAHIHVAHHGVRGGGHRDLAAPLEFEVSERRPEGFSASFRSVGLALDDAGGAALRGARVAFVAPNLVHYESLYEDPTLRSGLALYSAPRGRDRCRLLYRAYNNFPRLRDRLRPRWLEHWTQCTILEQDMDVVQGQVDEMLRAGRPPRELWLPLKSSDALVIAYRRWLDEHGLGAAQIGFDRLQPAAAARPPTVPFDRLSMHTEICTSCTRAHRRLLAARAPLSFAAFTLLAVAAAGGGVPAAATALAVAAGRIGIDRLERRFRGRGT
ncbi:MAG: Rieske 2Fe-2S domain-containing protein [Acidobacteriota bacterium]